MPRIAGAGLIGRSWAIMLARAGKDVALHDAASGAGTELAMVADGLTELREHVARR